MNIKQDNQEKGRQITRLRYHNNKDEILKKRKEAYDKMKADILITIEEIEKEQAILEAWEERNSNEHSVMKR